MPSITMLANWLLRLPLLWGGLATLLFYASLRGGWVESELVHRYFASHPVEVVATLLFFVGVAAVGVRLTSLLRQFAAVSLQPLGAIPPGGQPTSEAGALLERLQRLSEPVRDSLIGRRLRDAVQYVCDTGSADLLENHLSRLEEVDRERIASAYALPSLIRATLPIVGMLGTVIGITLAIGQLSPDQLEESLTEVMAALSVAFDTTAQAMSLMLVLWFVMFAVQRVEERLLDDVDLAAKKQLLGRFQVYGGATDPHVASIRRMGEQVISAVDQLADRQAQTWQSAIDATHERWRETTATTGELLTSTLTEGLREGMRDHAAGLNAGVENQLATLSSGLGRQQQQVTDAIRDQLESLKKFHVEHVERIAGVTESETSRIVSGADRLLSNLGDGLERMAELLVEALQKHGETLTDAEKELASENRRHLAEVEAAIGEAMVVAADRQEKLVRQSELVVREMQQALVSAASASIDHQSELVKQGEVLLKVVESTGQVQRLEESLNRNLATLGRTHNLEETLLSLSAAIQLLSARTTLPTTDQSASTPKAA